MMTETPSPRLEFSEKYDQRHAEQYFHKHKAGFWRRMSNLRDMAIARKALKIAGDPDSVLDLPSGAGRFWALLAEKPGRKLYAADYSVNMLQIARQMQPEQIGERFETFQCSAFDIPWPDQQIDTIFCMRLVHHIGNSSDRLALFREFNRVASKSVCLSLWIDGNYKARRRHRLESRRGNQGYQNRFVVNADLVEAEFREAGMQIIDHVDFLKFHSMWRIYILATSAGA